MNSDAPGTMPTTPEGARFLRLGARVELNNLDCDEHESQWHPVLMVEDHTRISRGDVAIVPCSVR